MKTRTNQNQVSKVSEMIGFSDMGMHKEACALAKNILAEERMDAVAFKEAIIVLLVHAEGIESWKNLIQTAYSRLPKRGQQQVQTDMFSCYHSIKEWQTAMKFLSHNTNDPVHLALGMEVCLGIDRLDQAKKIYLRCHRILAKPADHFSGSLLLNAMASYCERLGKLDEAEQCWLQLAELDEPSIQNALSGLVRIQIVRAWKRLLHGLGQIEKFKFNIDEETALKLPGNHDELLADAKKELETYREALEKIVPQSKLGLFGMVK